MPDPDPLPSLGWLEWIGLPGLGIEALQAKIDTGAKTSCLHAEECEEIDLNGVEGVRFLVRTQLGEYRVECPVHDRRQVRSSSGHEEMRPVIETDCRWGATDWRIELTLTDRGSMRFPMLLGRRAMAGRFVVDPGKRYNGGRRKRPRKAKRRKRRPDA